MTAAPPAGGAGGVDEPPGGAGGVDEPGQHRAGSHLGAVDVMRFVTVAGVIAVHTTSLSAPRSSLTAGGVLAVLHVTRSVFLFLSAFVLTYSFERRPLPPRAFWRRRYPLVAAPYVAWSAIYVLTDGNLHRGAAFVVEHFLLDLTDGGAHFHLYFLLLTFQLYLVFPALIGWLRRHRRAHAPLLGASVAFQLLFTAGAHYGWRPPALGIWFTHAGSWLPSYELYVAGGILAALHFEQVTAWTRAHGRAIGVAYLLSVALAELSYVVDMKVLGFSPIRAAQVFQPTVTLEAVTATLALYALGLSVTDRVGKRRRRMLERSADVSFGVYLAHPLLVGGILDVAAASGLSAAVGHLPGGLVEAFAMFAMVPAVYYVTFWGVDLLRRTPASLWLTGRRGPRPTPAPLSAPVPSAPVV